MSDRLPVTPSLVVTADGAAWLPDEETLVVADLHVGYARAARRRGGWLPGDAESPAVLAARLRAACARVGASRLVIAGDLRHSTRDVDAGERAEVAELLARLGDGGTDVLRTQLAVTSRAPDGTNASAPPIGRVDVIGGNHDRGDGLATRLAVGSVDVVHEPPDAPPARWTVCGHLHPTTTLRDETGAALRVPCALVGERVLVLPAFTEWAGGIRAGRARRALGWGAWREVACAGGRAWAVND